MRICRMILAVSLAILPASAGWAEVTVRARVTEMEPEARVRIFWTWGGSGQGGEVVKGEWTQVKPRQPPAVPDGTEARPEDDPLLEILQKPESQPDFLLEEGSTFDYRWLRKGVWSPELPLSAFRNGGLYYVTVYAEGCQSDNFKVRTPLKRAVFEFEVREGGKPLKIFSEASPGGAVATIVLPMRALENGKAGPAFLEQARGLAEFSRSRREFMEGLPWAKDRLPERYEMLTDCGGYGTESGARTSSRTVFFDEFRILRQLGVNGLRGKPAFFLDAARERQPQARELCRAMIGGGGGGYPFEPAPFDHESGKLRPLPWPEGAGCPFHPVHSNRAVQARARLQAELAQAREEPFATRWTLTVDEIGSAFDLTAEGKAHMGVCSNCIAKFLAYLGEKGLTPADFDAKDWSPVRPTFGYFAKPYDQRVRESQEAFRNSLPKPEDAPASLAVPKSGATIDDTVADLSDEEVERGGAKVIEKALEAKAGPREGLTSPTPALSARGWHKLEYWSRRFLNDGSAMLFTPIRDAYAEANAAKRKAIAEGRLDAVEAKQPWMFLYSLRGNTFLMGGQSVDFFDFYRYSDTGFMYETSNRDPRVWPWDSYLCDVGRILHDKMGLAFGIYVKPHRGAGTQRALSAIARGARCIYWYTYGPEWCKGDSFGGSSNTMMIVSRAARLIGEAEAVTWEGRWTKPAEVAVVRPRTSEFFGNSAQWEDGKWVYAALAHAHLPVDPLDEELLMSEPLSRYTAIYVTGSHIRRDVALRLVEYVEAGGTLYTGCGGLMRDEAGQAIPELLPVFGLAARGEPVLWGKVPRYGATALGSVAAITNAPADASVKLPGGAAFALQVGYEKLKPLAGADVLATFGDGSPALVRNRFGKGRAYLAGWYTGVEYATGVMKEGYNTAIDFSPAQCGVIASAARDAGAKPVVEASEAQVEGVRVVNPVSGREAVVLMNWARQGGNLVTFTALTVRVPDAAAWKGARSVWQRQALPVEKSGNDLLIRVGEMENGDVLLLE